MKKSVVVILLSLLCLNIYAQNLKRAINKEGKYGYTNSSGDTVIPCKYDKAYDFENGVAIVKNNPYYKLLDKTGKLREVNDLTYDGTFCISYENYIAAMPLILDFWECFIINEKGETISKLTHRSAEGFWQGQAKVYNLNQYNYINTKGELTDTWQNIVTPANIFNGTKYAFSNDKGELLTKFIYDVAGYFSEGMTYVAVADKNNSYSYKYGFINEKCEVVIPLQYEMVENFYLGKAKVTKNGKIYLINKKGDILTDGYQQIYTFTGGYIAQKEDKWAMFNNKNEQLTSWYENIADYYDNRFIFQQDGKIGVLNQKGDILVNNIYNSVNYFIDGIAIVSKKSEDSTILYGYIDTTGREITKIIYDIAYDFYYDIARVGKIEEYDEYYPTYLYGYIDKTGKPITDIKYKYAEEFYSDNAVIGDFDAETYIYRYGMINKKGQEVIPVEYDQLKYLSEGLAMAYKDGKYGYINAKNQVIIDFKYVYAYDFSEGLALVAEDTNEDAVYEYFYIDTKGNKISELTFDDGYSCYDGMAQVFFNDKSSTTNNYNYDNDYYANRKINFILKSGKLLAPDTLDYVDYFNDKNLIIVGKKDANKRINYTYMTRQGKYLIPFQLEIAYIDQLPRIKNTDQNYVTTYALADTKGKTISEFYSFIDKFSEGYAIVKNEDNKYTFINNKGKQITKDAWEKVEPFTAGKAKVYKDEKVTYIDTEGKILGDFKYDILAQTTYYKIIKYKDAYAIVNSKDELLTDKLDTVVTISPEVAKYQVKKLTGYLDVKNNKEVKFSEISEFKNGIAKAKYLGKYGYINNNYQWIVEPTYNQVADFENDKAKVILNAKYNYINAKGEILDKWKWDTNTEFVSYNELKFVKWNNKYALVSNDEIISEWFYYLEKINDDVIVKKQGVLYSIQPTGELLVYYVDNGLYIDYQYNDTEYMYGIKDNKDNLIVDYKYNYIAPYNEGFALAQNYNYDEYYYYYDYSYQFIDQTGNILNNQAYTGASDFSEGLAAVKIKDKYGFIDKTGKLVIDYLFTNAYSFYSGLAKVSDENYKTAYIDRTGKIVIDYSSDYLSDFYGDYAILTKYVTDGSDYFFVDRTGQVISELYDLITKFSADYFLVKKIILGKSKFAVLDKNLNLITQWYDYIENYYYKTPILAIKDKKIVLLNEDFKENNDPTVYEDYLSYNYYFTDELAPIYIYTYENYAGKYGFIDKNGKLIVECQYDYVQAFSNGYAIVQNYENTDQFYDYSYNYLYNIIDTKGNLLLKDWANNIIPLSNNNLFKITFKKDDIQKSNIVNKKFEIIIEDCEEIYELDEDYLLVLKNDKFNLYSYEGKLITDADLLNKKLSEKFLFNEGIAIFSIPIDLYTFKYGYLNSKGEIIIKPIFSNASNFSDGMALVGKTDEYYYTKYGYIDTKGNMVIDFKFDYAYSFVDGMAKVGTYNYDLYTYNYGFINKKGELVIDYLFAEVTDFKDGMAIATKNFDYNKMSAFINKEGKEISNWYDLLTLFIDNYSLALKYDKFILLNKDLKEVENTEVIKKMLKENYAFTDGLAIVNKNYTATYSQPNSVLVNEEGKIISEWYASIGAFKDGRALVAADLDNDWYSEYGYIDQTGKIAIPIQFQYAEDFKDGYAKVGIPSEDYSYRYGLIDLNGEYLVDANYADIRPFSEGYAVIGKSVDYVTKYGFIDKKQKIVLGCNYDYLGDMHDGMALVSKYDEYSYTSAYGYINKKGKQLIDYQYEYAADFAEGMAMVGKSKNNTYVYDYGYEDYNYSYVYGYINKKNNLIIDYQYDYATNFSDGIAVIGKYVDTNLEYNYIDNTSKLLSEWSKILYPFYKGYSLKLVDKKLILIDKTMKQVDNKELFNEIIAKNFTFNEGMSTIFDGAKYGFIDNQGNLIIDFKFSYAGYFYNGSAYVEMDYVPYYVNKKGEITKY